MDNSLLQKLYTLPIGLIEFKSDGKGNSQLGAVTPEIVRMLAGTRFLENLDSLDPFKKNNENLKELAKKLEQRSLVLTVGGEGDSRFIFLIDKNRLSKQQK